MSPYKICLVALNVGQADYARPCVAITIVNADGIFGALGISSKLDLFRADQHFLIREDHPDFAHTGLETTSYVIGAPVFDVEPLEVLKTYGELKGELAVEFAKWIGD